MDQKNSIRITNKNWIALHLIFNDNDHSKQFHCRLYGAAHATYTNDIS